MLLLYHHVRAYKPTHGCQFTFHYASTLSEKGCSGILTITGFTFHYASTLSEWYHTDRGVYQIYIPLCFYFILKTKVIDHVNKNLHSTMLLLYRRSSSGPSLTSPIYIPLCFYFIPSPFSPSIFFNTNILFVYPTFFIALFSKIFLLPLYKIWIFLDISSFVYLPAISLYLRSTIIRSCLSYHHPLPKIP